LIRPGIGTSYDVTSALLINTLIALSSIFIAIGVIRIDKITKILYAPNMKGKEQNITNNKSDS
jgi:hypothetical protein